MKKQAMPSLVWFIYQRSALIRWLYHRLFPSLRLRVNYYGCRYCNASVITDAHDGHKYCTHHDDGSLTVEIENRQPITRHAKDKDSRHESERQASANG